MRSSLISKLRAGLAALVVMSSTSLISESKIESKINNKDKENIMADKITLENAANREGIVTLKGGAKTLLGGSPKIGDAAPDFSALDAEFASVSLSSFKGKIVLISSVPSLDTPVCSVQTKKFNEEISKLSSYLVALTISNDLPFAQKRFCDAEKTSNMIFLSDSYRHEFGLRYGLIIKDMGILARAVLVIDRSGRIAYQEIVPEITSEPNYGMALEAIKKLQ